jgi:uncharacterized membrane protein (DUF373 family)
MQHFKTIEKVIITILMVLMAIVLVLAVYELTWLLISDIFSPPVLLLDISELLELFGFFLLVLIGIELLETIKTYFAERVVHVEVVADVALIAIARKVVILDVKEYEPLQLVGIAFIIAALAGTHWVIKWGRRREIFRETDH